MLTRSQGYLFDRRQVGRTLEAEWGKPPDEKDFVTCVRRFGRQTRGPGEVQGAEHVTGARMAQTNSYEVKLSPQLTSYVYILIGF